MTFIASDFLTSLFKNGHIEKNLSTPGKVHDSQLTDIPEGARIQGKVLDKKGVFDIIEVEGKQLKAKSDLPLPKDANVLLEMKKNGTPAEVRLISVLTGTEQEKQTLNKEFLNLKAGLSTFSLSFSKGEPENETASKVSQLPINSRANIESSVNYSSSIEKDIKNLIALFSNGKTPNPEKVEKAASFFSSFTALSPSFIGGNIKNDFITTLFNFAANFSFSQQDKEIKKTTPMVESEKKSLTASTSQSNETELKNNIFMPDKDASQKSKGLTFVFSGKTKVTEMENSGKIMREHLDPVAPLLAENGKTNTAEDATFTTSTQERALTPSSENGIKQLISNAGMLSQYQQHVEQQSGAHFFIFPFWLQSGQGYGHWSWWREEGKEQGHSVKEISHLAFDLELKNLGQVNVHLVMEGKNINFYATARESILHFLRKGVPDIKEVMDNLGFRLKAVDIFPLEESITNGIGDPIGSISSSNNLHIVT